MDELNRFSDPYDDFGLRAWHAPRKNRLLKRWAKLKLKPTIPTRRGFYLLQDYFGKPLDWLGALELEYAFQRLLILDWSTKFRFLGFFTEVEIRGHAQLNGPPEASVLGHYWYGLLGREDLRDVERISRRRYRFTGPCALTERTL